MREHLELSLQRRAATPADIAKHAARRKRLDGPGYPDELDYLFGWWLELSAHRRPDGWGGVHPLEWPDVKAWAELTDRRLQPHEAEALMALDRADRAPGPDPDDED